MRCAVRIGSLFAGIGGLELGLEQAGLGHVVWQVERDPYCRAVLSKHWPEVERHDDVTTFKPERGSADLICGGFPCQPWSVAGKRLGSSDERHLWPEFARIVEEVQPAVVIGENVPGLRARGLRVVLADLARLGFDAEWAVLAASDVGAPHRRQRLFIVATHPERVVVRGKQGWLSRACRSAAALAANDGCEESLANTDGERELQQAGFERAVGGQVGNGGESLANADGRRLEIGGEQPAREEHQAAERGSPQGGRFWTVEPDVGRVAHGVPRRVDRLRCLGNAVVPQVAEVIGRAIVASIGVSSSRSHYPQGPVLS